MGSLERLKSSLPVDSATALARTPLFASLGRLELARLAGELEELDLKAGAFLMREGEPGDALYVVRSGIAQVFSGAKPPEGVPTVLLAPGEVIGEIALLTGAPRSASVVAWTDLAVWRLRAERFLALLDRDRTIARSIERTLGRRLADSTNKATDYQEQGQRLAHLALGNLPSEASRLLAVVALLPRWEVETLRRVCACTGDEHALELLERDGGLLWREGQDYVVPSVVADAWRASSPERLAMSGGKERIFAAGQGLEASGAFAAAVELYLGVGAFDHATRVMLAQQATLRESVPVEQRAGWVALVTTDDTSLRGLLAPLADRTAPEAAGPDARDQLVDRICGAAVHAAQAEAHTHTHFQRLRRLPLARLLATIAAVILYGLAWLLPVPEGLSRPALVALGAIIASLPLLLFDVLPSYTVAVLLATVLIIPGTVQPAQALAGFGTSSWLLILVLFAISAAFAHSGLLYRVALMSMERTPANLILQSLGLSLIGVVLTAGISSRNARVALAAPAAREVAEALRYGPRSRESAALGLMTYLSFSEVTTIFLTGSSISLLLQGMLPEPARSQFTFGYWAIAALAPNVILFALSALAIFIIFRPKIVGSVDREKIRTQLRLLGPLTGAEASSLIALLVLIVGFVTEPYHGINAAWIATIVFVGLFATGTLSDSAFHSSAHFFGQLIYFGVLLSLSGLFSQLKIDTWLTSIMQGVLQGYATNPYLLVLAIAVTAFLLHFVVPFNTASPLLALVTIPLALSQGFSPFVPVITTLVAGDHSFLRYLSPPYLTMHDASDGELFDHDQARPVNQLGAIFRVVALVASVPFWSVLGLV